MILGRLRNYKFQLNHSDEAGSNRPGSSSMFETEAEYVQDELSSEVLIKIARINPDANVLELRIIQPVGTSNSPVLVNAEKGEARDAKVT